jgi:hypothetical protein
MCVHGPAIIRARRNGVKRGRGPLGGNGQVHSAARRASCRKWPHGPTGRRVRRLTGQGDPGEGNPGQGGNPPRTRDQFSWERLRRPRRAAMKPTPAIPPTAMSAGARRSPETKCARPSTTATVTSTPPAMRIRLRDILSPLRVAPPGPGPVALGAAGDPRCLATIAEGPAPKRSESTIRFRRAPESPPEPHKTTLAPRNPNSPGTARAVEAATEPAYGLP